MAEHACVGQWCVYFIRVRMTDLHLHAPWAPLGILLTRADADSCFHLTESRVLTPSPPLISISDHVIFSWSVCLPIFTHHRRLGGITIKGGEISTYMWPFSSGPQQTDETGEEKQECCIQLGSYGKSVESSNPLRKDWNGLWAAQVPAFFTVSSNFGPW